VEAMPRTATARDDGASNALMRSKVFKASSKGIGSQPAPGVTVSELRYLAAVKSDSSVRYAPGRNGSSLKHRLLAGYFAFSPQLFCLVLVFAVGDAVRDQLRDVRGIIRICRGICRIRGV
jgi:hypothetical protein